VRQKKRGLDPQFVESEQRLRNPRDEIHGVVEAGFADKLEVLLFKPIVFDIQAESLIRKGAVLKPSEGRLQAKQRLAVEEPELIKLGSRGAGKDTRLVDIAPRFGVVIEINVAVFADARVYFEVRHGRGTGVVQRGRGVIQGSEPPEAMA